MRTVAVFCGSRSGISPAFHTAAATLGRGLAEAGIGVVYGGGQVGLMGVLANAVLAAGGRIVGVIPEVLMRQEVVHRGLTGLIVTRDIASRKQRMFDLADAFITLPGGIGTLDETVEMLTWRQLGLHQKPVLICDIQGSAAPLVAAVETAVAQGFAAPSILDYFEVFPAVAPLLDKLHMLQRVPVTKRSSQWTL